MKYEFVIQCAPDWHPYCIKDAQEVNGIERIYMKKTLRLALRTAGLLSIFVLGISATTTFAYTRAFVDRTFSEPINMVLIGMGLIGISTFFKKNLKRDSDSG